MNMDRRPPKTNNLGPFTKSKISFLIFHESKVRGGGGCSWNGVFFSFTRYTYWTFGLKHPVYFIISELKSITHI